MVGFHSFFTRFQNPDIVFWAGCTGEAMRLEGRHAGGQQQRMSCWGDIFAPRPMTFPQAARSEIKGGIEIRASGEFITLKN